MKQSEWIVFNINENYLNKNNQNMCDPVDSNTFDFTFNEINAFSF